MILKRKPGKAFNALSVSVGLGLLSFWIYFVSRIAATQQVRQPHCILLLGFGAILTLFIVKVTCTLPAVAGTAYLSFIVGVAAYVLVGPPQGQAAKTLLLVGPMAAAGVPIYSLLRKVLPKSLNIGGNELAVIYTIVVIGTATAMISRSAVHSAANLWRDEYKLEKWIPPHFLPAPAARDDIPGQAHRWPMESPRPVAVAEREIAFSSRDMDERPKKRILIERGAKKGLFEGNAKVPWWSWYVSGFGKGRQVAGWTFPAIFWTMLVLTVEFFFLFLVLVFRKRWIEEERLPFPMAQLPLTIIGAGQEAEGKGAFSTRARWIAFGIGFALCVSAILSISPTGADGVTPLQYLFTDVLRSRIDLTGRAFVPYHLRIVWLAPLALTVMLFAPLEVLSTSLLTFFVTWVVIYWTFERLGMGARGYPGYITRGIAIGGGAGLVFWTLVFQWRELERLVVAFVRRTRTASERGFFSARNLLLAFWAVSLVWAAWVYPAIYGTALTPATRWLLLLGTVLAFLYMVLSSRNEKVDEKDDFAVGARGLFLLLAATGLSFIALTLPGRSVSLLIASSVIIFSYAFASIRARAEAPMHEFYEYDQGRLDAAVQARYVPGPADGQLGIEAGGNRWWNLPPGTLSHFYTWEIGAYFRRWAPHNHFLDTFKIGRETGASASDILKAIVLAMVIAAVVTPVLTLSISYKYGFGGANVPMYWYYDYITATGRTYIFGTSTMEPPRHYDVSGIYTFPVMGFFLMGLMIYMRREYVWFPLHPIGFLMGSWMYQGFGVNQHLWFTLLVAYAFKRLIFRWFGVRYFRQKVQPVLVFALVGMLLGISLFLLRYALELGIGIFRWS